MNIVVCVKAVPSTTNVRMDPVTNTIVRDGRQSVVNPFDASALEEALCIQEELTSQGNRRSQGARGRCVPDVRESPCNAASGDSPHTITVLSMGIPDTERLLRDCLSRGADRGVLLSDRAFAGADTLATSYALSCAIRQMEEPVDLILCGKMAVDGDTAQIGPELASVLGMACVTDVCEVLEVSEDHLLLRRATDEGHAVVETPLPAVVTVTKDIRIPRMPSIAGVRFGQTGPVEVKNAAAAGADPARTGLAGSPTQVVRSFTPERSSESVPVEGTPSEQGAQLAALVGELLA